MLGDLRRTATTVVVAAALIVLAAPADHAEAVAAATPRASITSDMTAGRPAGRFVLEDVGVDARGSIRVRVSDTRSDDPGWSVIAAGAACSTELVERTPSFTDGAGVIYAQMVENGGAAAGHGLGLAALRLSCAPGASVTVTVI